MIRRLVLFLFFGLMTAFAASAQETVPDTATVDSAAIKRKQLIEKYRERMRNNTKRGFRIQVFSGNSRSQAMKIRTEILTAFPDNRVYLIYKQPTFRVRVGDFVNKQEATTLFQELSKRYKAAFIVPDNILLQPVGPVKTNPDSLGDLF